MHIGGMLKRLLHDGIFDYVAMEIKNSPQCYAETCGVQARTGDELARLRQAMLPYIPNTQLRGI